MPRLRCYSVARSHVDTRWLQPVYPTFPFTRSRPVDYARTGDIVDVTLPVTLRPDLTTRWLFTDYGYPHNLHLRCGLRWRLRSSYVGG